MSTALPGSRGALLIAHLIKLRDVAPQVGKNSKIWGPQSFPSLPVTQQGWGFVVNPPRGVPVARPNPPGGTWGPPPPGHWPGLQPP